MLNNDTEVCVCNSLTAGDIAQCIKKNNFKSLDELFDSQDCPLGDKCESCKEDGFNNDGINVPLVFSMVKSEKL